MKMLSEFSRSECACRTCQSACENMPGWFLPKEVEAAATVLGLSTREFVSRYTTVDFWVDDPTVYLLRPRQIFEPGGGMASGSIFPPEGRCVFLTPDGRCEIHVAKPFECAVTVHAQTEFGRIEAIAREWDGVQSWLWEIVRGAAEADD